MILTLTAFILLFIAPPPPAVPAAPASPTPVASTTAPSTIGGRVWIQENRHRELGGTVELEDDEVILVRRADGKIESFTKARVLKIVRLRQPAPEQSGTVYLRNGQVAHGLIIEDGFEKVVVNVEGIHVEFRRKAVAEVVLEPTFDELYERFKTTLQPNQYEDHLDLCRWLVRRHRYDLAHRELEELLEQNRDHDGARRLIHLVEAQMDLQAGRLAAATQPDAPFGVAGEPNAGPVRTEAMLPSRLLTHADVNLMRVYEIDFERPPKAAIDPDTIRTLLETYGANPLVPADAEWRTGLFRADPIDIVALMFELRSRELYPQINVLSEPYSLNQFRQRVHNTWLMNNCATSRCHSGPDAGRFFLHNRNHKDERVRYTNLLILERLDLDPQWPLINYGSPIDSLIVQHGLPRELARRPHPPVKGWKPVFNRGNQRMLNATIDWIRSMMQPRPDYPVEFVPEIPGEPAGLEPAEPAPAGLTDTDRQTR